MAGLLLLFAVAFNLYRLYAEVAVRAPLLNDGVLHLLALERSAAALAAVLMGALGKGLVSSGWLLSPSLPTRP
jgi:hypothetical protein